MGRPLNSPPPKSAHKQTSGWVADVNGSDELLWKFRRVSRDARSKTRFIYVMVDPSLCIDQFALCDFSQSLDRHQDTPGNLFAYRAAGPKCYPKRNHGAVP
jgi:hypothetical protein